MTTKKLIKLLALYLPYILLGLVATNFGEAWRLAEGKELGDKIMSMMGTIPVAFANPLPSLHPLDLLVGLCCGAGLRLAVYLRGKNAKKYRHGMEYGSARWGTPKDIEPFMAPKFADNIILTKTERLMMSNRPPDPKNARNKNVLVVGGSGSGKTRFWLKPNLLQCHSSYVVTDPKGSVDDKYPDVLPIHALPQFLNAATGGKAVKDGSAQQVVVLFKKTVHGDLVHAEKDVVLDHILKPVGQQAGEANRYVLSGLGLGIHVQGMGFKVSAVAQDSVVVQIVEGSNYHTHASSASKIWTGLPFSFT